MTITQIVTKNTDTATADLAFVSTGGLRRVRLGGVPVAPPAELWRGLLLTGKTHVWEGDSGIGKSLAAMAVSADLIREGSKVMYLDHENGPRRVAERMASLGVGAAALEDRFFYYYAPDMSPQAFAEELERVEPALVVFDSLIGFLAVEGIHENDNAALRRWATDYPMAAKRRGTTTLTLDHTTKAGNQSRGAGDKMAAVDVRFNVVAVSGKGFDRRKAGQIRFKLKKDNDAALAEPLLTYEIGGTPCVFRPGVALTKNERKALDTFIEGGTSKEWEEATAWPIRPSKPPGKSSWRQSSCTWSPGGTTAPVSPPIRSKNPFGPPGPAGTKTPLDSWLRRPEKSRYLQAKCTVL